MNKRILAALLCMVMVFGLLPTPAAATEHTAAANQVTALEVPGESRLDTLELPQKADTALYDDQTVVTVIVELTDESVLSGFRPGSSAELSIGQQVSEYLANATAEKAALEKSQDALLTQMRGTLGSDIAVAARWTGVINAMAVEIPYGKLAQLQAMEGVKRAYVEKEYDRPVTTVGEAIGGTHGYSYNMTDLAAVWEAGYTGQGMLVAVLDTGIDLDYTTWGNYQTGVRQVHQAFTDESFRTDVSELNLRYTNASLARFLQTTQLLSTTGIDGQKVVYDNNALFKNLKVPYAADYADGDLNVKPMESDHGTHVSGTIAGYAETAEGEVIFSGVAPDAQILSMKVFPDSSEAGGASESIIISALEDAMLLGADVVNLSLGSDNGFAHDDTAANAVYDRLSQAGIIFMVSAGNSGTSSYGNNYGGNSLSANPEVSMMAAPAVYDNNLSVASINNTVLAQSRLTWTDEAGNATSIPFADPTGIAMKYQFGGKEPVEVIVVDGYGTYSDYYNAGFRSYYGYESTKGASGIALVKRGGGISFSDKINTATQFVWSYYDSARGTYVYETPIKAVIVYDEDSNSTELINMSVENMGITSCFISGVDGHALAEAAKNGTVRLTAEKEDLILEDPTGYEMSSFSTWGAGPALELKPEITAPGGNIWSTLPDTTYVPTDYSGTFDDYEGTYGMMSGTSMAAPHMSSIALLVEQAVRDQHSLTAKNAVAELSEHLMISTAVPVKDANGVYYSPRQQGAGLVNAAAAITTPAYISVDGANVGKLELKDDPQRTGSYDLSFHVNNISDRDVTYTINATLMRPATDVFESQFGTTETIMCTNEVVLINEDLGTITVPAGQTLTVSKTVSLTAEQMAEIDELFPNGTYVEGFVTLTSESEPQIGLPVLAFYGDWTSAPIFDSSIWFNTPDDGENLFNNASTFGNTFIGSNSAAGYVNLGQNLFNPFFGEQALYHTENFTISPNGDGYLDSINDFVLYQLREARLTVIEVRDAETDELYYRDFTTYQFKSLYYDAYGYAIPASQFFFTATAWNGTDLEGNPLPSGTRCVMSVSAYSDGDYGDTIYEDEAGRMVTNFEAVAAGEIIPTFNGHELDMTGDVIEYPIVVDTVAPKLENNAVSIYVGEDGRTYMSGTVYDVDGSIASIEIVPQVTRRYAEGYGNPDYIEYGLDDDNAFYVEHVYDAAAKTLTFTADVTEYAHTNESYPGENNYYVFDWTGNVFISCGDYGMNDRTYAVTVSTGDGIVLSQTNALMYVGGEFEMSVIDNTGIDGELVRASSNPEVATIDEFGKVVALAPGQTTITVSKGSQQAVCIVAVRERETEVIDFKLSIDSFSSLKPNGTLIVRVTDLEPANVELYQKHWIVTEDDPELYEGLINVAQYDTTGLAGELYLNYQATGDPEITVPGASGTLAVTLNGVTRTMHIDWNDLYTYSGEDDLVSAANFYDQSVYINQGETATLVAKYNDSSAHNVCDVALYTGIGAESYSYNNPAEPAVGLKLDGPTFAATNSTWKGKLVNEEGYALPENIRVFTRYDYGGGSFYESELINYSYYPYFSYDSATGEIEVFSTPYSETNILVIRADGIESEGNPAGEFSGETYEKPEGIYGPFDWSVTRGNGELTPAEGVSVGYETQNVAYYTPAEPGLSIITATSRDGKYTLNFAVISQGILPDTLTLSQKELTISVGDTATVDATLTPEPTLAQHAKVTWTSYNPDVASVDPDTGLITAHAEGYAYIRACANVQTGLEAGLVVHVIPCVHENTTTTTVEATCLTDGSITVTCDKCHAVISQEILPAGHAYESAVTAPTCTEDGFTTHTCSVCGDSYTDSIVPATGHSYQVVTKDANCTEGGHILYTCTACGDSYAVELTPALGHDYESVVTEPTCTEGGFTTHTCTVCGHSYVDELTPALGHDYESVVTEPTCTEGGFTTHTCSVCAHSYTDELTPALGHTYETRVTEATCTHIGTKTHTCTVCGHSYTEFIAPTGHDFVDVVVEPNCTEPGYTQHTCTVCGYVCADSFTDPLDCPSAPFEDVDTGSWYHEAVDYVVSAGLMNGISGTQFDPEGTTTRAQVVTVLYRLAGTPEVSGEMPFDDVTEEGYYYDAVLWAYQNGIAKGISGDTFAPDQNVNRAQLVTFLYRYAAPEGEADTSVLEDFTDADTLDAYAVDAFVWAVSNGLIAGMEGTLNPSGTATRAQLATVLMRYAELIK